MSELIEEVSRIERLKMKLVSLTGYLLPLLSSFPGLVPYTFLMTIPFIVFLTIIGGQLQELHVFLPFLFLDGHLLDILVQNLGFILLLVSVFFLWKGKKEGLVTQGVYRVVRHPQYLGLILFTAGLTSRSELRLHTDGLGWLTIQQTILFWILMVVAYNILAFIEEIHLSKVFADSFIYEDYRSRVGFMIPCPIKLPRISEIVLGIALPTILLNALLFFHWY